MIYNIYWKDRPRTPEGWIPEEDHEIRLLIQREIPVRAFVRDGVQVDIENDIDLEYLTEKFEQLDFNPAY